jgi:Fe-Mn family superoxide dismutase
VWNHTFFWNCLEPGGGGQPGGDIHHGLGDAFGSYDAFRQQFIEAGAAQFGSGYVWLVLDQSRALRIVSTANADNPLTSGQIPLLTCDLWEHAYYLDRRNDRGAYLDVFLRHLVNWDRIAASLKEAA